MVIEDNADKDHEGADDDVNAAPADFSDSSEEDNPAADQLNKQALLEWLTIADFTKEISLMKLAQHKYKLDPEERDMMLDTQQLLKIIKV